MWWGARARASCPRPCGARIIEAGKPLGRGRRLTSACSCRALRGTEEAVDLCAGRHHPSSTGASLGGHVRPQLMRDPLGSRDDHVRVNTLKALPALKYLLADVGVEPPDIPVRIGWEVFQKFLRLPADSSPDDAAFQTAWLRENPDAPVFEVLLGRQLTDANPTLGPLTRLVALQFLFDHAPSHLTELEIWSSEFPSLDRFLDHIERQAEFEYALDAGPSSADAILAQEE